MFHTPAPIHTFPTRRSSDLLRAAARASIKFARFTQATSRINPTIPARTNKGRENWARRSLAKPVRKGDASNPIERNVWRRKRSEEHTSELQSRVDLVCRLLL